MTISRSIKNISDINQISNNIQSNNKNQNKKLLGKFAIVCVATNQAIVPLTTIINTKIEDSDFHNDNFD